MLSFSWAVITATSVLDVYTTPAAALALASPASFLLAGDMCPAPGPPGRGGLVARLGAGTPRRGAINVATLALVITLPLVPWPCGVQAPLEVVILALCAAGLITSWLQRPYLAGLAANPVWAWASRGGRATYGSSRLLASLGALHRSANFLGSLAIVAHVSVSGLDAPCPTVAGGYGPLSGPGRVLRVVLSCRVLRRAWQCPPAAMLEGSVAILVSRYALSGVPPWPPHNLMVLWLASGVLISRLAELRSKLTFAWILLLTSWTDTKQRARRAGTLLAADLAFFPVVMAVVAVATVLSAPLLPLLGVPLFVVGFPRPRRHWPPASGPPQTLSEIELRLVLNRRRNHRHPPASSSPCLLLTSALPCLERRLRPGFLTCAFVRLAPDLGPGGSILPAGLARASRQRVPCGRGRWPRRRAGWRGVPTSQERQPPGADTGPREHPPKKQLVPWCIPGRSGM